MPPSIRTNGRIKYTTAWNEFTQETTITKIEWEGGPIIQVRRKDVGGCKVGDTAWVGPYRVRILEMDSWELWSTDCVLVARDDFPFCTIMLRYLVPLFRRMRDVSHRLIMTLQVWGLAKYDHGAYPDWSDVHLIRRLVNDGPLRLTYRRATAGLRAILRLALSRAANHRVSSRRGK